MSEGFIFKNGVAATGLGVGDGLVRIFMLPFKEKADAKTDSQEEQDDEDDATDRYDDAGKYSISGLEKTRCLR